MKEVFAIDLKKTGESSVLSVRKQSGKYLISPIENLENTSRTEIFARKNAGRAISTFPFADTYLHELNIPDKISRKSYLQVIRTSTEAALPMHLNERFHFDLPVNDSGGKVRRLEFIAAVPKNAEALYESELLELQPSAFFEGFSHLFKIPDHQKCFLFYQAPEYILLIAGQGKRIEKIRVLKGLEDNQFVNAVSDFLKNSNASCLYSWCTEKEERLLSALPVLQSSGQRWNHLKNSSIPEELNVSCDNIELACQAVALFEGLINPCRRISPQGISVARGNLSKSLNYMTIAMTALLCSFLFFFHLQIRREKILENAINQNISNLFYSFFPSQTPMIDPAQQISESIKNAPKNKSSLNMPDAGIFLQLLSEFFQDKAQDQTVSRITQDGGRIYIEGEYQSKEMLEKSAHAFDHIKPNGLRIRFLKLEQPDDGHYRLTFAFQKTGL